MLVVTGGFDNVPPSNQMDSQQDRLFVIGLSAITLVACYAAFVWLLTDRARRMSSGRWSYFGHTASLQIRATVNQGHSRRARRYLKKLIELTRNDNGDSCALRAKVQEDLGDSDATLSDVPEAINHFPSSYARSSPSASRLLPLPGDLCSGCKKDAAAANEDFTNVIELQPDHALAYMSRASFCARS